MEQSEKSEQPGEVIEDLSMKKIDEEKTEAKEINEDIENEDVEMSEPTENEEKPELENDAEKTKCYDENKETETKTEEIEPFEEKEEVKKPENESETEKDVPAIDTTPEKDNDSDGDDENDEDTEGGPKLEFQVGRTVTLQMLLAAKLLEPGPAAMSIEYLGQKFVGDLLPDGRIKSIETETIFCSPSAWAMHCKRIINPEKKSGCGWASVRYKNKKLDAIKTTYLRKCQIQRDSNLSDEAEADLDCKPGLPELEIKRIVLPFNTVNNRHIVHDPNTLVESVSFVSLNKLQPFLVSITTSSVLLMDFHCHLTKQEVCGYLGGSWDNNTQTLAITHAFPVRNTRHDRHYAIEIEQQIQRNMLKKNLILVGWYHSHPRIAAQPTLRDCDAQLEYQIKMCGISDETYTPCVGLICAPYYSENPTLESSISAFWVVPPLDNRPMEYGRPMSMQFSVSQDLEMSEHIKTEMLLAIDYYRQYDNEMVNFDAKYDDDVTFIEKLKTTLYTKFPREQNDFEFWNWLRQNLGLQPETEFTPPKLWSSSNEQNAQGSQINTRGTAVESTQMTTHKMAPIFGVKDVEMKEPEIVEIKDDDDDRIKDSDIPANLSMSTSMDSKDIKDEKLQIRSLQEQLKLPSGLNMTPSPISSIPLLQPTKSTSSSSTATNNPVPMVSPRDSPISTPSNSASPATKFDIRPPATPSPAKSDASSTRNRNSPLPANLSKYPAYHNTPTSTKTGSIANDSTLAATKAMEELLAASFPGGKFPYSSNDYATLLQQASSKDLTAAANLLASIPPGDKHASSLAAAALDPSTNMKDFLSQLEKSTELSYLLQQQYQYPGLAGMSHMGQGSNSSSNVQITTPKSTKHSKRNSRSSSNSSVQRNFEDEFKSESSKKSDPSNNSYHEYAQFLLNQAEALNAAVAHQNYGEISSIVSAINTLPTNTSVSAMSSRKSRKSSTTTQPIQSVSSQPSLAELSQLLHGTSSSSSKMQEILRQMESTTAGLNIKQSQKQQHQQQQQQQQQQHQQQQQQQQQQHLNLLSSMQQQLGQSSKGSSSGSSSKNKQSQNNQISDYMTLLSQAKIPDLATLMAQSYGSGNDGSDLSMLLRSQYDQHGMNKNSDLASLNASIDMLGNLFSSGKNPSDLNSINSLLFPQGGKGVSSQSDITNFLAAAGHQSMNPPSSSQSFSKSSALNNPYYSQSAAALDKAQQDLIALYSANPISSSMSGGSSKFPTIPDPLSKSTLAANNMFMNPSSIYAKIQQDALNAMIMKPPSKTSSKGESKSRETSESPASRIMASPSSTPSPSSTKHNFSVVDLAVSSVNQGRPSSRSPHKKQFSISDLVSPPPSKMMKFAENFAHDAHNDDKAEVLNLSGNSSDK
ncbi:MPN domain-containing protein CG4751 [Contarinia nasturtii]|uniref:MPN domain-containing protein CG4751 n=1 Tax=Contarinia nasturtii TaxID=265458 RepID=UPI0012D419DA|nr:MPN domain-containing protein CG4751 [Contarinia nasturtii]